MRTLVQKPETSRRDLRGTPGTRRRAPLEHGSEAAGTAANRSGHDFSRIPVFAPADAVNQPKLLIGSPRNRYEEEADRVANQVMRMPEPACGAECTESVAGQSGKALDPGTRRFMESRFGHDFGRVRIHADAGAAQAASALGARAFTTGNDVVFGAGQYAPDTLPGRQLLAHELTHVVQQRAAGATGLIQRQEEGTPAAQPAGDAVSGQEAPQAVPQPPQALPQRRWTPQIPHIWFDLHDFFRAVAEPQGPYLYSSHAYVDRVVNPNFENNLNPGPARDLNTRGPSGMRAQRNDLLWFFYTKFFVDAADAHLPAQFTRFETSADIRFMPTAGGTGFSYQFSDNSPVYTSPGTLSFPFYLSTKPYAFGAQDVILEPGTLLWNARLLVAQSDDRIPLGIDFVPPPGIADRNALSAALTSRGLRFREPAAGEAADRYRVSYTPRGNDRFDVHIELTTEDGGVFPRTLPNVSRNMLLDIPVLVILIGTDFTVSGGSSAGRRHVEIRASQRVPFERPATSAP